MLVEIARGRNPPVERPIEALWEVPVAMWYSASTIVTTRPV